MAMIRMGFDLQFVLWILKCIQSSSFSFSINGEVKGYIKPAREIRQGSGSYIPYLFLICSEVLSGMIRMAIGNNRVRA